MTDTTPFANRARNLPVCHTMMHFPRRMPYAISTFLFDAKNHADDSFIVHHVSIFDLPLSPLIWNCSLLSSGSNTYSYQYSLASRSYECPFLCKPSGEKATIDRVVVSPGVLQGATIIRRPTKTSHPQGCDYRGFLGSAGLVRLILLEQHVVR
jgi:hypothetical protein